MVFLKSIGAALLSELGGCLAGAFLGMFLIHECPENSSGKASEEATTSLLIVGPFAGLMTAFGGAACSFTSRRKA